MRRVETPLADERRALAPGAGWVAEREAEGVGIRLRIPTAQATAIERRPGDLRVYRPPLK